MLRDRIMSVVMEVVNMHPILAQYTIRSKQEYIFKTNKIVEIVGASSHIRDAWDYLFARAEKAGKKIERNNASNYDHARTLAGFESGKLQMTELFCGGGNETVLFDSKETYLEVNKAFSYFLLKECPGMIPMAVCVPVTNDYEADYRRLMTVADREKNRMTDGQENFILPFSLMDRDTFSPMTISDTIEGELKRYSEESYSKRIKGIEERNSDRAVKILDSMVTRKGKESLLAVVHADGNNMGSKIMEMLKGRNSYDDCVNVMREFTSNTANAFVNDGLKAIDQRKKDLLQKGIDEKKLAYRVVVKDGDDMTFICNARYVMEYIKAYIEAVRNYDSKWNYSSCAGICIFHSHYPFAKAYELAEQACDYGAKAKVHKVDADGKALAIEEGWVDFHYIHSGISDDLQRIREKHHTELCMARPWLIAGNSNTKFRLDNLYRLDALIKENKIARAAIKTIGALAEESPETGLRELNKLYDHLPNKKSTLRKDVEALFGEIKGDNYDQLKAFYDYAEVYDLWFKEDK